MKLKKLRCACLIQCCALSWRGGHGPRLPQAPPRPHLAHPQPARAFSYSVSRTATARKAPLAERVYRTPTIPDAQAPPDYYKLYSLICERGQDRHYSGVGLSVLNVFRMGTPYYGSAAIGAIVGNSHQRCVCPSRGSPGGRSSQRHCERSQKVVPKPGVLCHSQLVPCCEAWAHVPKVLLSTYPTYRSGPPYAAGTPDTVTNHEGHRDVLAVLVLTPNALSIYDGPSRARRLAVLPLRQLCAVELLHAACGLFLQFHAVVPAAVRPPPLPLDAAILPHAQLGASLYFEAVPASAALRWLSALRAALCSLPSDPGRLIFPCVDPVLRKRRVGAANAGVAQPCVAYTSAPLPDLGLSVRLAGVMVPGSPAGCHPVRDAVPPPLMFPAESADQSTDDDTGSTHALGSLHDLL